MISLHLANWRKRCAARLVQEGWPHLALLFGILLLAALLRMVGLRFGLPYFDHPDEWAVGDEALRMLQTGDFSPLSFTYPTLYVYLQVGVAALHYAWGATLGIYSSPESIDPARFYLWARSLTALLGVATVGQTYLIGRKVAGRETGLIAALFLATLPLAVADSHYLTVDTPAACVTALAFLLILSIAPAKTHEVLGTGHAPAPGDNQLLPWIQWRVLIAGIAVGLAASTKYTAGVVSVPLLVAAVWQTQPQITSADRVRAVAAAGVGVGIGFTIGTPLWLPELSRLLADLAGIARHYREEGHPGAESSRPALFYWGALYKEAAIIACAALGGVILALIRRTKADLLMIALVFPFMLQLSSVRVVFVRNFMPVLPFACVLAAMALIWAIGALTQPVFKAIRGIGAQRGTKLRTALLATCALLAIAQPIAGAAHDSWLLSQPTTRILATQWVLAHAPIGARIWLEDQTLILPTTLRVEGGRPVTSHPPDWYRAQGFRFLVANMSIAKSDTTLLPAFGEPAARFATDGQRHGHLFAIYDTGVGDPASEPRTPSGATLGSGALVLDGYTHAGSAAPGGVLRLALYWRVARQLDQDYVVYVHLVDAQGTKQAQRDTQPLDGSRPTTTWQVGELIRDDQDLLLPATIPPGHYTLLVGMYNAATLVAINDSGPIPVGEIDIR